MPKIQYENCKFDELAQSMIQLVNQIVALYDAQNIRLTSRTVFYQFVSRDWLPATWADPKTGSTNNERSYKKLCGRIARGRLAGLVDWAAIDDRMRQLSSLAHWSSPAAIISACAGGFRLAKWDRQPNYVEVWVEKDALVGVIEGVCEENDVPYLACRGYASATAMWEAGHNRLRDRCMAKKECIVLYLGDHDPSGIDMTRDVEERLKLFIRAPHNRHLRVERLALNMDQVELYNPPPNPTKITDSRCQGYRDAYGDECWELDALDPVVIRDLIADAIGRYKNQRLWNEAVAEENDAKRHLAGVAANWDHVVAGLPGATDDETPNIFDEEE